MWSKAVILLIFVAFSLLAAADSQERGLKYLSRAADLVKQKKYAEAVVECDRIIHWKVDFAEAYQMRGAANAYLGRSDAALRDLTTALRYKPEYPVALEGRAGLY